MNSYVIDRNNNIGSMLLKDEAMSYISREEIVINIIKNRKEKF